LSIVCPKSIDFKTAVLVLLTARQEVSSQELMFRLNQTNKNRFLKNFIRPLAALNLLEYTVAAKPTSGKQKYFITDQGRALVEKEGAS
jgi:hypothetical protein